LGWCWLGDLNKLFNLNLNFVFFLNGDLFVDGEWSFGEEELDSSVIIDAEQITGRKGESINLKRFVLVASLLIVWRPYHRYKFY
jgi:hypothetical protein